MKITTRDFVRSACATVLALGCGISVAAAQPAVIIERGVMPAPRVEVIPAVPGPGYNWVPGHWAWRGLGLDSRPSYSRRRPSNTCRRGRSGAGAAGAGILLGQRPPRLGRQPLGMAPGRLGALI